MQNTLYSGAVRHRCNNIRSYARLRRSVKGVCRRQDL